jgi:hypothetical protein
MAGGVARGLLACLAVLLLGATPPPVTFTDHASAFDRFEANTRVMPPEQRVAAFHVRFDALFPGYYVAKNTQKLDRRILAALDAFPTLRPAYREAEARFPVALETAVRRFRVVFPSFVPPIPIYLTHSLGIRDGGSQMVGGRKVMIFGADVIARLHNDSSMQPFLDHELFHLEHARHFADCDPTWCPLWQEGLATYAASVMTPSASEHQLLLDVPKPIPAATEARWPDALCWIALRFDQTGEANYEPAFLGGYHVDGLPDRFGYYIGLRIATEAAKHHMLSQLTRLSDEAARPVVAAALGSLIRRAHAPCQAPTTSPVPIPKTDPRLA